MVDAMNSTSEDNQNVIPSEPIDSQAMNRLLRHRLRNLCAGAKMTLDRISTQAGKPSVSEKCTVLCAEFDNLELFTRRMDLLFDRLPTPSPLYLCELLTSLRQSFARKHPLCALKLEGPEVELALRNGSLVETAVAELLANAGDAAGAEGAVTLRWEFAEQDTRLAFVITNTGAPIPAEIPLAPPAPFHTTRGRHDGLGLSIAHRIAKSLRGGLEIKSNTQDSICVAFNIPRPE